MTRSATRPVLFSFALCTAVFASACGTSLLRRFEADTGCPAADARATRLGAGLHEVQGCGVSARYVCTTQGTCVRDQGDTTEWSRSDGRLPPGVAEPPPPSPGSEAPVIPTGIQEGSNTDGELSVRLVLQDATHLIALTGISGEEDRGIEVRAYSRTNQALDCVFVSARSGEHQVRLDSRYEKLSFESLQLLSTAPFTFDFCGERQLPVLRPHLALIADFLGRLEGNDAEEAAPPSEPTAATNEPSPASSESGSTTRERVIRERIDAAQRGLTGCLGGEPGAIVAEWDANGSVSFSLSGAPDGAELHGCVRAAIGELQIPAGQPGRLLHPVQ